MCFDGFQGSSSQGVLVPEAVQARDPGQEIDRAPEKDVAPPVHLHHKDRVRQVARSSTV